jgi:hypothetical protein
MAAVPSNLSVKEHAEKTTKLYRSLEEFTDFVLLEKDTSRVLDFYTNQVFKATEKKASRNDSPYYEKNSYHIALRKSEFEAQVDKALSEINKFLLGYGPEVDIIQKGNDFYVASRTIRDFFHGFSAYSITTEGIFKKSNHKMRLKGLASMVAIAYFFGQSDIHSGNWGAQENGDEILCYKIDDVEALDPKILSTPITNQTINELCAHGQFSTKMSNDAEPKKYFFSVSKEICLTPEFREEFFMMMQKIANCDFNIIAKILQDNITTNKSFVAQWWMDKILSAREKGAEKISKETGVSLEECRKTLEVFNQNFESPESQAALKDSVKQGAHYFIQLLKPRQLCLRSILLSISAKKIINEVLYPKEMVISPEFLAQYRNEKVSTAVPINAVSSIITDYAFPDISSDSNEQNNGMKK